MFQTVIPQLRMLTAAISQSFYERGMGFTVPDVDGLFREFQSRDIVQCAAPSATSWVTREMAFLDPAGKGKPFAGTTAWCINSAQSEHFATSTAGFMVHCRVEELHGLVELLREESCNVLDRIDDSEYGKFAWAIDPEGHKVELWQPAAGQ